MQPQTERLAQLIEPIHDAALLVAGGLTARRRRRELHHLGSTAPR